MCLIHTAGKVGSTTLLKYLENNLTGTTFFHCHLMTRPMLNARNELRRHLSVNNKYHIENLEFTKYSDDLLLGRKVSRRSKSIPLDVFTLTRDPIARNISAFFQIFERSYYGHEEQFASEDHLLEDMLTNFIKNYRHDYFSEWFRREVLGYYGLSMTDIKFNTASGFGACQKDRLRIFFIQMEKLSELAPYVLRNFYGIDAPPVVNANTADAKPYSDLYKKFKERVRIPDNVLDEVYDSECTRFFYSKGQIDQFRNKWSR